MSYGPHLGASLWLRLKEFLGFRALRASSRPGPAPCDSAAAPVDAAAAPAFPGALSAGVPVVSSQARPRAADMHNATRSMQRGAPRTSTTGRTFCTDDATDESEAAVIAAQAIAKAAARARLDATRYPDFGSPEAAESFTVGVVHMWDFPGDGCMTFIDGFASAAAAAEYARRRTRDSVEELRKTGQSREDLRSAWGALGEACFAHRSGASEAFYAGYDDLAWFIDTPASPHERNWTAIDPRTTSGSRH